MQEEERRLRQRRHERIARTKRILRFLPRRSNVHRYPGLKWFARAARKRLYLWSFRVKAVVPALYAGCILALLPLYGVQLPLSALLALLVRANLPVLVGLQFISNPVTVVPVYLTGYQVGRACLNLFGMDLPPLNFEEMNAFLSALHSERLFLNLGYLARVWLVTSLGGIVLGSFLATAGAVIYKIAAYEVNLSYQRLRDLQRRNRASSDS
ncbi:MAG: DUF2062 domain-containing protein [Verrucomicrobia bacterium]|jgi:uncharacterized protein (DUF2062 family)|nr:DUF2062 domain-containing protein [Verrucomicrobiota bacterium]